MPDISLDVRLTDLVSDLSAPVCAWRTFVQARFRDVAGNDVAFSCAVDSGAPFSVIPYSLWHDRNLQWQALGSQLLRNGKVVPNALDWLGVSCQLGTTRVHLADPGRGTKAGPLLVVGKFAQARQARTEYEVTAILGLNFLTDNFGRLAFDAAGGQLAGSFSLP
jgi:hypothetical protein